MRAAIALSLSLAIVSATFGAAFQIFFSSSVPVGDIVDFYQQFLEVGGFAGYGLKQLYFWHNEHRLVIPRLWFLADVLVDDARQDFLRLVIFCSALAQTALLAALFRGLGHSARATAIAFVIAAGALLSPVQYENLLQGFQVQFVQVWLFAALAFALIAWAPVSGPSGDTAAGETCPRQSAVGRSGVFVVAAAIAGLCSTYSMINGLAVWPLLVAFTLWRRMPLVWVLALAVLGTAVIGVEVMALMQRRGAGVGIDTGLHPLAVLQFMAQYLASALGQIGTLGQRVVGGLAMAGVVLAGLHGLARPKTTSPVRMALLALCAFILAAALVTALGRLRFGAGLADSSRYTTPSMIFLLSVGMLAVDPLVRRVRAQALPWALGVSVVLLLVPGLVHGVREIPSRISTRDQAELAVASHIAGGYRPEILLNLYPHWAPRPAFVLDGLAAAQLGPFSERERYVPAPEVLATAPAPDAPTCHGDVRHLAVDLVRGVEIVATLVDPESGRQPDWLIARSSDRRTVAWGIGVHPFDSWATALQAKASERVFHAFGPAPDPLVDQITVEGAFRNGERCRLPGTVSAEPDLYLAALPAGAEPAGAGAWSFVRGPLTGGIGGGAAPAAAAPAIGSFGMAPHTFEASMTLGDPGSATGVLVPLRTGPWPHRSSVDLLAADGRRLASVPLRRPAARAWVWVALRSPVLGPGMRVVVQAIERRTGDDLAFGTPHWLP